MAIFLNFKVANDGETMMGFTAIGEQRSGFSVFDEAKMPLIDAVDNPASC
jgi:hypothetical protein